MLLVDTALPLPDTHHDFATGDRYTVTGRSTVVLVLMPEEGATRDVLVELEKTIHAAAAEIAAGEVGGAR